MRNVVWGTVPPANEQAATVKRIMEHLADIDRSLVEICGVAPTCQATDGWGRTRLVCGEPAIAQVTPPATQWIGWPTYEPRPFPVCASCRDKFMAHGYRIEQPIPSCAS